MHFMDKIPWIFDQMQCKEFVYIIKYILGNKKNQQKADNNIIKFMLVVYFCFMTIVL